MKNINIAKIHQLLKDAIEYKGDYAYGYIIKKCTEALALLPCPTCNGSGKKLISSCWDMIHKEIPCPDCQQHSP